MKPKFNPDVLLFQTALIFESDSKLAWSVSSNDPVLKRYEILIEIKDSTDRFRINADEKFNAVLFRGTASWKAQKIGELQKNENQLGAVIINKEKKLRKSYHNFEAFWDEIKRNSQKNNGSEIS